MCIYEWGISMKENVQLMPPALAGRKQRIKDFKQFIEANRKTRTPKQLLARYSLQIGIAPNTVKGYLKLFIDAGVYVKPHYEVSRLLLTPEEYKEANAKYLQKREEERKKREEEAKSYIYPDTL